MKNKFNILYIVLALGLLFACETEPILYDASNNHVAFVDGAVNIPEEATAPGAVPVIVTALLNSPAVTVDFEVDADQSVAVEGTDFTIENESNTLSYNEGMGYDTIWVQPIDNDVFGGNISFVLKLTANSQSYKFGAQDSIIVTIVDNEHPLKLVLGDYQVDFESGFTGGGAGAVSITTMPVPGDITQIAFKVNEMFPGWGFVDAELFYAVVDLEAMEIKIKAGQGAEDHGYGPSIFTGYDADTDEQFADGDYIIGTIDENGGIHIPHYTGLQITEGNNEGLWFDLWAYSDWTKSAGGIMISPTVNRTLRSLGTK